MPEHERGFHSWWGLPLENSHEHVYPCPWGCGEWESVAGMERRRQAPCALTQSVFSFLLPNNCNLVFLHGKALKHFVARTYWLMQGSKLVCNSLVCPIWNFGKTVIWVAKSDSIWIGLQDMFASERRKAKMLNFSIAYGKTAMGLSKDWKVRLVSFCMSLCARSDRVIS